MTIPTPVMDIYEADLDSLVQEVAGVPHPTCVIGEGYGSRDAMQKWSIMDLSWKGPWFEEVVTVQNGFMDAGGILVSMTQAQYDDRQVDIRYKAVGDLGGNRPNPGDYVRLFLDDEKPVFRTLQIQDVEIDPARKTTLQLGKRAFDEIDAFNARTSLGDTYMQDYLTECGTAITLSPTGAMTLGDDTDGWGTLSMGSFTIPTVINSVANNCRVTLSISMSSELMDIPKAEGEMYLDLGGTFLNGYFNHYVIQDTITGIDLTPFITFGVAQTLVVYAKLRGEWIGTNPTVKMSATLNAYRRVTRA